MKAVTKYQAETAEAVLRSALDEKRNKMTEEAFKKAIAKHENAVKLIVVKAKALVESINKLKDSVEKDSRLEVNVDNYNYNFHKMVRFIQTSIIQQKSSYRCDGDSFAPDFSKEEAEITSFVLGLKLGTVVMADMKPLLDRIKSL